VILSSGTERLVYFGDSLSDRGLIYGLTGEVLKVALPPASEGYAGRFSNGEVQSGITPALLGLETESYAAGGAQARGSRTIGDYVASLADPDILLPPPLPQDVLDTDTFLAGQVQSFLADLGPGGAESGTAAVIFIGANDYNSIDLANPPDPAAFIGQVVGSIYAAAKAVDAAGADQVLLYNLPDPTFFPVELIYDPATIAFGQQLAAAHNAALAGAAAQLRSEGIDAQIVDIYRIAAEITADPRTFGLLPQYLDAPKLLGIGSRPIWDPVSDSWSIPHNPAVANVDPERLAYFDLLHPTTATHGVLGAFAAEYLTSRLHLRGDGDDLVLGWGRDDLVLAGAGDDKVVAGAGDDVVLAGLGDDLVAGWGGDDILAGGGGDDTLLGGRGDDVIAGSDGRDLQFAAGGRDLLIDGLGEDLLAGGCGRDAFLYTEAAALGGGNAADGGRFVGGSGRDTLYLVLGEETRAEVEAELRAGPNQHLASIGIVARSIERYVFLDPADDLDAIVTGARIEEADAWGFA
jgi:phospholipase/lecithinase/hemolysin